MSPSSRSSPSGRITTLPCDENGEGWRIAPTHRRLNLLLLVGLGFSLVGLCLPLSLSSTDWTGFLFALPFLIGGLTALFFGLFLGFGTTELRLTRRRVSRQRILLGRRIERVLQADGPVACHLEPITGEGDPDQFYLSFEGDEGKPLTLGSALDLGDVRWLYEQVSTALGQEFDREASIHELAFSSRLPMGEPEPISGPAFRIGPTDTGFEIRARGRRWLFCFVMGLFFGGSAYCMALGFPEILVEKLDWFRAFLESDGVTKERPPALFPIAFGLGGIGAFLLGFVILGYRSRTTFDRDSLAHRVSVLGVGKTRRWERSQLSEVRGEYTGSSSGEPRYRVRMTAVDGSSGPVLCRFRSAEEAGTIVVWTKRWLDS